MTVTRLNDTQLETAIIDLLSEAQNRRSMRAYLADLLADIATETREITQSFEDQLDLLIPPRGTVP